jgi:hypothetical protein
VDDAKVALRKKQLTLKKCDEAHTTARDNASGALEETGPSRATGPHLLPPMGPHLLTGALMETQVALEKAKGELAEAEAEVTRLDWADVT